MLGFSFPFYLAAVETAAVGSKETFADAVSYLGRDWKVESGDILLSSRRVGH